MLLDRMAQIQTETRVSVVVMLKRIYLPFYRRFFHSESVVVFLSVTNVSSTFLTSKRNASDKNQLPLQSTYSVHTVGTYRSVMTVVFCSLWFEFGHNSCVHPSSVFCEHRRGLLCCSFSYKFLKLSL